MKQLMLSVFIGMISLLGGCAKMPLTAATERIAADAPAIYLMTVQLENVYKPRYQPAVKQVIVVRKNAVGNDSFATLLMDEEGVVKGSREDEPARYLVRLQMDPGAHVIQQINARGVAFPIFGNFTVLLNAPLTVGGPGITYLGSLSGRVLEGQSGKPSAGPLLPIIDQAISGASTGTFEVAIRDRYDEDVPLFRARFPALKAVEIGKAILPPVERAGVSALPVPK